MTACGVGFVANIKGRKSHDIIRRGLQILVNLDHRGAVGADPLVGDGAGCLIQMPDALLRDWAGEHGIDAAAARPLRRRHVLPAAGRQGARLSPIQHVRAFRPAEGQTLLGWRDVPTDTTGLGARVHRDDAGDPPGDRRARPEDRGPGRVRAQDPDDPQADAEHVARASATKRQLPGLSELYMPSFSTRTVVYKGLLLAPQVGQLLRRICAIR